MKSALVMLIALVGAAQTGAPVPATYLSDAELTATLKETAKSAPDMHTAPVQNTDHYRINVVERTRPQGAIAHPGFIEVHHIISGAGTLVTGGAIVRAAWSRGRQRDNRGRPDPPRGQRRCRARAGWRPALVQGSGGNADVSRSAVSGDQIAR